MLRCVSVRSTVGFLAVAGLICGTLAFAQGALQAQGQGRGGAAAQAGGNAGGRGGGGRGAAAPPIVSVMKVEWVRPASQTAQVAMVQENVADPNVEVKWYGEAAKQVLTSGTPGSETAPFSVWTGEAEGPFAITFRHKTNNFDLSGLSKIRWMTKTSGFHVVRPVVKLTDGTLLVGDHTEYHVPMLTLTDVALSDVRWIKLDPERAVTVSPGNANPAGTVQGANEIWVVRPDLSKVEEVGFADLMPASGHGTGGYIHVAGIEVFGKAVPR